MANKRQEILEAVAAQVKLALPAVDVFIQRFLPSSILPAVVVYTLGDSSQVAPNAPIADIRTEEVRVVIHDQGKEAHENPPAGQSISEKINAYAAAIESRFNLQYYNLGDLTQRFEYVGTDISFKVEGETVIGIASLKYNAVYVDHYQ